MKITKRDVPNMSELESKINKEFAGDRKNMVDDEGETVDEAEVPESAKLQVGKGGVIENDTIVPEGIKDAAADKDTTVPATIDPPKVKDSKKDSETHPEDAAVKEDKKEDSEMAPSTDGDNLGLDDPATPGDDNGDKDEGDPKDADDDTEEPPKQPDDGLVLDDPTTETKEETMKQNSQAVQIIDSLPEMPQLAPLPVDVTTQNTYPPMLPNRPLTEDQSSLSIGCVAFVTIILLLFIFKPKNNYQKISHQDSNKSI